MRALYKYPQGEFPYADLVRENRRRGIASPEYELEDTGAFRDNRYWDVTAEYAKASPDDLLVRVTVTNRGPEAAELDVLPTLWFRNTWSWGRTGEGYWPRPRIRQPLPRRSWSGASSWSGICSPASDCRTVAGPNRGPRGDGRRPRPLRPQGRTSADRSARRPSSFATSRRFTARATAATAARSTTSR